MTGVAVDATARTATAARELALAAGHEDAFNRLMVRLVPADQLANVPPQTPDRIATLVRNFEVAGEKTSSVRYLATLTVRFAPSAIRDLLREAGIPFAETRSNPMLVLPVYRVAGVHLLWDRPNPWRESWAALPPAYGLVPLIVPTGDLADIAAISAEQAALGQEDRLRTIAERYDAGGVILALAALGRDPDSGAPALEVTLTRFGRVTQDRTVVRTFTGAVDEQIGALIQEATLATAERIQEDWKNEKLLRFDRQNEITVVVRLNGLADWVSMQRTLDAVAFVQSSRLVSLTRYEATVELRFLGDEERLRVAFAERNLTLERGATSWLLSRASDAGGGTAPREPAPE